MIKKLLFFGILFLTLSVMGFSQTKTDTAKTKPIRVKLQKAKIQPRRVSSGIESSKVIKQRKSQFPENNSDTIEKNKKIDSHT